MARARNDEQLFIRQLLAQCGLPVSDLDDRSSDIRFFVAHDGAKRVGIIGVQVVGEIGLLRSLAVVPEQRGRGFGQRLVAEAERAGLQTRLRKLVLLTETAAAFFARLGYAPADRAAMPAAVQATAEFSSLCPSTATCLAKSLALSIYHNPDCGTSRNVLALMRAACLDPQVIEYLHNPPDRETLIGLMRRMRITPRELLREKGTPYAELGLDDVSLSDEALIDRMLEHPILINRPIVVAPWGVKLCRPSEAARQFLHLD